MIPDCPTRLASADPFTLASGQYCSCNACRPVAYRRVTVGESGADSFPTFAAAMEALAARVSAPGQLQAGEALVGHVVLPPGQHAAWGEAEADVAIGTGHVFVTGGAGVALALGASSWVLSAANEVSPLMITANIAHHT